MYKKILWLSALTACFITVFFAIFSLTKVNFNGIFPQTLEAKAISSCPPSTEENPKNPPLHNAICPRSHCKNCPHHENEDKKSPNSLKEMADDSTEDSLIITPQILEQCRHLPHSRENRHIWQFLNPLFAPMPNDFEDTFDVKFKNSFVIEILQNRDESGWHFYINGLEVTPNENNMTPNTPENNNMTNNSTNDLENTPMPLPELEQNRPITDNSTMENGTPNLNEPQQPTPNATDNNQAEQTPENAVPEQQNPNDTPQNIPEDASVLPEQTPYM